MQLIQDRQGNISVFRVSLAISVFGGLLLFLGILSFVVDQESRRAPFFPDVPTNANSWGGIDQFSASQQRAYYRVDGGNIETVVQFYDDLMLSHYNVSVNDLNRERCQRFPPIDNFADYEPGDGTVPFYYTCMFDRGGLNLQQSTQVTIQPGIPNEDEFLNSEGAVVIIYDQRWQP